MPDLCRVCVEGRTLRRRRTTYGRGLFAASGPTHDRDNALIRVSPLTEVGHCDGSRDDLAGNQHMPADRTAAVIWRPALRFVWR